LKSENETSETQKEGLVKIHIDEVKFKDYIGLCRQLVLDYNVPEKLIFSLFHRLRIASLVSDATSRQKLVKVRILAIAALGYYLI